ncbi:hypothetical protein F2Q69_00053470 [Brassica cretica]|uniref:Uncharacterized protein n=1 Tax=Brassica cretica TaxID=69181 RepID=A0A8S9N7D6_BRACR|nr:hypothetical protein F2Q69_00053470 [Brassica cretica]
MDGSLRSDQTNALVGRYVATDLIADRSLRSDRPRGLVGRYIAIDSLRIGRYVATNREAWSVATYRPTRCGSVATHVAADGILYGCRGKTTSCHLMLEYWPRDKFWDLVSWYLILYLEMLETSVLGLGQDLGLITTLGGAMTTSTYVSRIVFDLIPSRFKVRDMFSAYVTCMVGIEHLFEDNF